MNASATPLKFLGIGWFASVMGLCGLALAWLRAQPLLGEMAGAAALVIAAFAGVVFLVILVSYGLRARRYPMAFSEDFKHPVRHPFVATLPMSMLLLATLGVAFGGTPSVAVAALWALGAAAQLAVTLWILGRWLQPGQALTWASVTPVLLIPVVGNVLVPLAGVPLGFEAWSAAQFGIGLLFWPLILVLLFVRMAINGLWPERMLLSTFITVPAPSLIGLVALQWKAVPSLVWMMWGVSAFFLLWSLNVVRRALQQPFSLAFWSVSFPLAAFSSITLRLGEGSAPWFQMLGLATLAIATLVIAGLCVATVKGLRQGSLLQPEPVANIQPVAQT